MTTFPDTSEILEQSMFLLHQLHLPVHQSLIFFLHVSEIVFQTSHNFKMVPVHMLTSFQGFIIPSISHVHIILIYLLIYISRQQRLLLVIVHLSPPEIIHIAIPPTLHVHRLLIPSEVLRNFCPPAVDRLRIANWLRFLNIHFIFKRSTVALLLFLDRFSDIQLIPDIFLVITLIDIHLDTIFVIGSRQHHFPLHPLSPRHFLTSIVTLQVPDPIRISA